MIRSHTISFRILCALLAIMLGLPAEAARERKPSNTPGQLDPPDENLPSPGVVKMAKEDLGRGAWADAASRIDLLLMDQPDALFAPDDDRLLSVTGWIQTLPAEQMASLRSRAAGPMEPAARASLEMLRHDPAARPEAFYAVAMRYPYTLAAAEALLDAGDRSLRLGDANGTADFYTLAESCGAVLNDARQGDRAVALTLMGQPSANPPAAAQARLAEMAAPKGFTGPITFESTWWENPADVYRARYFPYAADGVYYLLGFKHLLAIKENGNLLWKWQPIDADSRTEPDRINIRGHGTPYAPAVLANAAGPQIIFARQARAGSREFGIRAFRVADGKLLWTTETNPAVDNLSIVSNPVVAGRFLYCVGVEFTNLDGTLFLAGFESLTGKPVFRCPLGQLPEVRRLQHKNHPTDDFWEQTEPAVAGDCVYVAPNVGAAFCVGRFDGKLRWMRVYSDEKGGQPVPPEANKHLRYRCTPWVSGNTVVIAPQDTTATFGLNARTGEKLWSAPWSPAHTLIGGADNTAVLAGSKLAGIDAITGKRKWLTEFPASSPVSGPPVIAGGNIYVLRKDTPVAALTLDTGKPAEAKFKHPNFRPIWSGDVSRKILEEALMLRSFDKAADASPLSPVKRVP